MESHSSWLLVVVCDVSPAVDELFDERSFTHDQTSSLQLAQYC